MRYGWFWLALLPGVSCGGKSDLGGGGARGGTGGGSTPLTACDRPSDCIVVPASCCGSCGAPTPDDVRAVNADEWARAGGDPGCVGRGCPACFTMDLQPNLVATCDAGTCLAVDLLTDPATACRTADDCRVRTAECCECGADLSVGRLIALSDEAKLGRLVCDVGQSCGECAPIYPPYVGPECIGGHCTVTQFLTGSNPR